MSEPIGACTVEDMGDSLRISIRNRPHRLTVVWAVACIVAAIPFVLMVPPALASDGGLGALAILAIIPVVLGVSAFIPGSILAWQLGGQETVVFHSNELKVIRNALGVTRERVFALLSVGSVRVMPTEHDIGGKWRHLRPATVSTFHIGRICFEYQGSVYRIGSGLTTEEASAIVDAIVRFREESGQ